MPQARLDLRLSLTMTRTPTLSPVSRVEIQVETLNRRRALMMLGQAFMPIAGIRILEHGVTTLEEEGGVETETNNLRGVEEVVEKGHHNIHRDIKDLHNREGLMITLDWTLRAVLILRTIINRATEVVGSGIILHRW